MTYTWRLSSKFETEFANLPENDQDKILDFTDVFEVSGLTDFTKYQGKISQSWSGENMSQEDYDYAKDNHLWHYHVGIPHYEQEHPKFKTSDWVVHFQWPNMGNSISLVDLYSHHKYDGSFYLPPKSRLDED